MAGSKESSPPCLEPVTTDEDDFHDMPTLEVQTDLDLADELHDHTGEIYFYVISLLQCGPHCSLPKMVGVYMCSCLTISLRYLCYNVVLLDLIGCAWYEFPQMSHSYIVAYGYGYLYIIYYKISTYTCVCVLKNYLRIILGGKVPQKAPRSQ